MGLIVFVYLMQGYYSALASIAISHRILFCAPVVALSDKNSTIQHGYRKYETHARVFSQALANGNT